MKPLKISTLFFIFLFFGGGLSSNAQITVNSLTELLPYLDDDGVDVKLAQGTYTINNSNINDFNNPIFLFEGNNSTYDFTGVTIDYDTEIFTAFGSVAVKEIEIVGNNNVLKNLTMVDVGSIYDRPQKTALGMSLHGQDNLVEGFNMTIKGSQPYGYGDIFGKGSGYIIKHFKHSAMLVGGDRNHIKNCNIIHRAYGHGIAMQGAVDTKIEGVYLEGEVRTTDAMLAGAYGGDGDTGEDKDWITEWGYRLPAGYMLSLQEDGIRAYTRGTTIINGETVSDRRTTNITVLNCTVKNMRSGYSLSLGAGSKYVEGCTSIGNESGFGLGSGEVVNCFGDAAYGTVYDGSSGVEGSMTLIAPENGYYNGSKSIASIGGGTLTMHYATTDVPSDLDIKFGGHRSFRHLEGSNLLYQVDSVFSGATLYNHSDIGIDIGLGVSNCNISTCGVVVDNGSGNSINFWDDCESVVVNTCSKSTSLTQAECYDDSLGVQVVNGSVVGYIENGDWVSYNNLDLSGMNSVEMTFASQTSGGTIEFRLDAVDGEVIGEMTLEGTGGWETWETATINIDRVEGAHDLYLVFIGGDDYLFDLDKFGFSEEVFCNNSVEHIEAECFDDMFEIQNETCDEGGENIGYIENGDWTMYSGIDLTGMKSMNVRIACNFDGGTIEVRQGSESGAVIGLIPVTNTEGNQNWVTNSVNITPITGLQDVYLVFKGGDGYLYNINWFGFSETEIVVTDLKDIVRTDFGVYPNPVKNNLTIEMQSGKSFILYNQVSEAVVEGDINTEKFTINLESMPKGVYFLKIENNFQTIKIIKQ